MTHRNGTPTPLVTPQQITPHHLYAAAALTGLLANPEIQHDTDRMTAHADRIAERMVERDLGR